MKKTNTNLKKMYKKNKKYEIMRRERKGMGLREKRKNIVGKNKYMLSCMVRTKALVH